jgi:S-formylglutathione hydrolase
MSGIEQVSAARCFGGEVRYYRHASTATATDMEFSVYLPPAARRGPVPVLYWLSGLTCTAENFTTKAGAQRYAAEHGIMLVAPDTSPRGAGVAGEDDDWDLGTGAGFYVNATTEPWKRNYRMYDYVVEELPALVEANLPAVAGLRSVAGHSMGGHGALVVALRNPGRYRSVSAFAPIAAPGRCPWGRKAFTAYLGPQEEGWASWDASRLVADAPERLPILVDQGDADPFLAEQLLPEVLRDACLEAGHPMELCIRAGYDHSYWFIASFIGEHIRWHARALAE